MCCSFILFFSYFSLKYLIDCWILSYTVLAATVLYLFVTGLEGNFGSNVGV